jgi:hypothetical protein
MKFNLVSGRTGKLLISRIGDVVPDIVMGKEWVERNACGRFLPHQPK